jgi:hypothetical protein
MVSSLINKILLEKNPDKSLQSVKSVFFKHRDRNDILCRSLYKLLAIQLTQTQPFSQNLVLDRK